MFENQRIFLLFAVVFIGFLLFEAWQQDYHPEPTPQAETTASSEPQTAPSNSELPALTVDSNEQQARDTASTSSTTPIEVTTPLVKLLIDPRGGDIIKADLVKYPLHLETPGEPFTLLTPDPLHLFIAQSGLISDKGPDTLKGERFTFQSVQQSYHLNDASQELQVVLNWQNAEGLTVKKIFTLKGDSYAINVRYVVDNKSTVPWSGKFYGQLKRKNANPNNNSGFGTAAYFGAALSTPDKSYEKIDFEELSEQELNKEVKGGWLAFIQHYFIGAWIPSSENVHNYYSKDLGNEVFRIGFTNPTVTVQPAEQKEIGAKLYIGPKIQEQLKTAAPKLELTVDYGWLWFLAEPLFWLLHWLYKLVGNWGWAIVLVTMIVKALFFQLSATSYKSMAKMRKVQPRMAALKERHGDDRQQFSQAIMKLYQEEKINPLGGCFPILIQIPVFIALYWVLLESVELRHAGFIFWISDLSAKDPYYVLPILMGVTMLIQQMLSPAPPDAMQAKMMKILPIIFTFFFLFFPAGLVLYWLVSNILSIGQQWLITRVILKP